MLHDPNYVEVLLVSELFKKGRFTVPWHQRYYDWTVEHVAELLLDLKEALDEERSSYFLGSIMLVEGEDVWEINDGQQRLMTLSCSSRHSAGGSPGNGESMPMPRQMLALGMLFDRPQNAVANLDDTTRDAPRIEPPLQDRSRFAQIIRGHDIGTNGKLTSAWNEIDLFVTAMGRRENRAFFDFLMQKVEIGILYVPKTEDANAVFEALNGRGKQLDDVDLIRNHLYSYFTDPADSERRTTVHKQLESVLATTRSATRTQEYFRCFFQCRYGYIQKKRFYRDTRGKIRDPVRRRRDDDYVYALVDELANPATVELFRTITASNPSEDLLDAFCAASRTRQSKRNLPVFVRELRGYKVVQPLMFALLRKFMEADSQHRRSIAKAVHRCLGDLSSFVMRVSFCEAKFEPSRVEPAFANCARRIAASTSISIHADLEECDDLQIMDNARFISRLLGVKMKDARRAKRLLFGINAEQEREAQALDYEGCTVEHILPQSDTHWSSWTGFNAVGSDLQDWVSRIGNLTLLGDSGNFARPRFNADFTTKKPVFRESPFAMTRAIAQLDDWTPEARRRALDGARQDGRSSVVLFRVQGTVMVKMFQRSEPFHFNHNALLRIPSIRHAVYVFWSVSKSKAVYIGKTNREVGQRLREHRRRSQNVTLRAWIACAPDDLMVCYASVPETLVLKLERRLIRRLDPEANDLLKS